MKDARGPLHLVQELQVNSNILSLDLVEVPIIGKHDNPVACRLNL